jgi:hypothetical protein
MEKHTKADFSTEYLYPVNNIQLKTPFPSNIKFPLRANPTNKGAVQKRERTAQGKDNKRATL